MKIPGFTKAHPGFAKTHVDQQQDVKAYAYRRTGYLRFHEAKNAQGNTAMHREIGVKEHGLMGRAIRFFGGPTKQDMADNEAIRTQFYHEFKSEFPSFGDKMLESIGYINKNPETNHYRLTNPTKPVSAGAITKLLEAARLNYAEGRDINDKGKEWEDTFKVVGLTI